MSGNLLSAQDFAISHFITCETLGITTGIRSPSALKMLEIQLSKMAEKDEGYLGAFTAYWLSRQKPFTSANLVSAVVMSSVVSGVTISGDKIRRLCATIKSGGDVAAIQSVLEA